MVTSAASASKTPSVNGPLIPAPVDKAPRRVVVLMAACQFGLFFALLTPAQASLTIRVQSLVAPQETAGALGLVSGIGAVAAFVANPIFGRISDRTTGRFGRRRPWLVIGALGLLTGLLLIGIAGSVALVAVGWTLAQLAGNAAAAAQMATLSDQVPAFQRGKVSGLIGVMQNAPVLAAAYTADVLSEQMLPLFLVPGVVALVLSIGFAMVLPDKELPARPPSEGWRTVLRTFWVSPRRHPDFAFAWLSRFLIMLANCMFMTFRLLYIEEHLALPAEAATGTMATGVLFYTVALVIAAQLVGWLSDRIRRRKPFVAVSTVVAAAGMMQLALVESVSGFYLGELVLGVGMGVFMGVGTALVVDVLPNPDDAAKDLGVFNIANAAPQSLASALGVVLLGVGGGQNYGLLLGSAAGICVLGGLAILPMRGAR